MEVPKPCCGRPTLSTEVAESSKHKAEIRPDIDIRLDTINHFPVHSDKALPTRCKNIGCDGRSRWKCSKCDVHLCLTIKNNCFYSFHHK